VFFPVDFNEDVERIAEHGNGKVFTEKLCDILGCGTDIEYYCIARFNEGGSFFTDSYLFSGSPRFFVGNEILFLFTFGICIVSEYCTAGDKFNNTVIFKKGEISSDRHLGDAELFRQFPDAHRVFEPEEIDDCFDSFVFFQVRLSFISLCSF